MVNNINYKFLIPINLSGTTGIFVHAIYNISNFFINEKINYLDSDISLEFFGSGKIIIDKNKSKKDIDRFNIECFNNLLEISKLKKTITISFDKYSYNFNKLLEKKIYSDVAKKIVWNKEIIKNFDIFKEKYINNNTLGIHIRFTSMKAHNNIYGNVSFNKYIDNINLFINKYNINNLFIASDNEEAIEIIKNNFPNCKINYLENINRCENIDDNGWDKEIFNRCNNKESFKEVIYDVLLLSNCKYLIHRVSSVSNLALLLSDTIKVSECLNNDNIFY